MAEEDEVDPSPPPLQCAHVAISDFLRPFQFQTDFQSFPRSAGASTQYSNNLCCEFQQTEFLPWKVENSVADPDPGYGAFLTPGSGIGFFRIPDPKPILLRALFCCCFCIRDPGCVKIRIRDPG